MLRLAVVVTTATLATVGCSSNPVGDDCGGCPVGEVCGPDLACHAICNGSQDCGICQICLNGMCLPVDQCAGDVDGSGDNDSGGDDQAPPVGDTDDPCAACGPDQVCVAEQCFESCAGGARCDSGYQCVQDAGLAYCLKRSSVQAVGDLPATVHSSSSPSYQLRGTTLPYTAQGTTANGLRLTPPLK